MAQGDRRGHLLTLSSGRRVAYREYGPAHGKPVLYLHGSGGNGVAPHLENWAQATGLRFVSPDRPGLGHSDFQPGRTIAGYADDVAALADHLGLTRFSCLGVSGGGPYALACAARLPTRVERVVCASAMGPPDAPTSGAAAQRLAQVRRLTRHGHRLAALRLLPAQAAQVLLLARVADSFLRRQAASSALPAEDRRALARPDVHAAQVAALRSARLRDVRGTAWELQLYLSPWSFALQDIRVPVDFWVGLADASVAPESGRWMAEQIPGARVTELDDAGHAMVFEHWRAVLASLLE